MYQPDTILKLKDPRSTDDEPFPYDRVRVVGQSPVDHGLRSSQWAGANGQGVIIQPLAGFASTADEPYGKLQRLYDVESVPVIEVPVAATVEIRPQEDAGPSPEDVFAAAASDEDAARAQRKAPAPLVSPLDGEIQGEDVPPSESPLGETEEADLGPRTETADDSAPKSVLD